MSAAAVIQAIPVLGDLIGGIFQRRHERKMAKHESDIKKIEADGQLEVAMVTAQAERVARNDVADIQLEALMQENTTKSWKDEYVLIWITAIFTGLFIPGVQMYVIDGFYAAEMYVPEWFKWTLGIILTASYGITRFERYRTLMGGKS